MLGDRFGEKRGLAGRVETECWVTGLVRRGDWRVEWRRSVGDRFGEKRGQAGRVETECG